MYSLLPNGTQLALKTRVLSHYPLTVGRQSRGYGNVTTALTNIEVRGWQTTSSESHPSWRKQLHEGGNVGGAFFTKKTLYEDISKVNTTVFSDAQYLGRPGYIYSGPLLPGPPPSYSTVAKGNTPAEVLAMYSQGTTAISRVIPTNPVASATVFLGELREGLPHIVGSALLKSKLKDARKLGDEYLNVEFGIKPLISDIMSFANSVQNHTKIVNQLERDSGRLIRRNYTFPTITTTTETATKTLPYPALNYYYYTGGNNPWTLTETTVKEVTYKFSGAFTYYLTQGNSTREQMMRHSQEARKLLGLSSPTISDVYNLVPWSWALDWVSNAGDVFHNISQFAQDGLVMPYGYIQRHEKTLTTRRIRGGGYLSGGPNELADAFGYETKSRLIASPFGFGLNIGDFTDRQWSIAAALGLARAPKKLL